MSPATTTEATLRADGTLVLDEKLSLAPGRVQVTVQPLAPVLTNDVFWERMQGIWDAQEAAGVVPRSEEEIERERDLVRDEWEQRLTELGRPLPTANGGG